MLARQCSALLHAPRGPAGLAETGPAPSGAAAPAGVSARGPRSAALLALSEHTGERRNVWWSVHVWPDPASSLRSSVSEDGLSWKDANRSEWTAHREFGYGLGDSRKGLEAELRAASWRGPAGGPQEEQLWPGRRDLVGGRPAGRGRFRGARCACRSPAGRKDRR